MTQHKLIDALGQAAIVIREFWSGYWKSPHGC